jgi:hypothetical protein
MTNPIAKSDPTPGSWKGAFAAWLTALATWQS